MMSTALHSKRNLDKEIDSKAQRMYISLITILLWVADYYGMFEELDVESIFQRSEDTSSEEVLPTELPILQQQNGECMIMQKQLQNMNLNLTI